MKDTILMDDPYAVLGLYSPLPSLPPEYAVEIEDIEKAYKRHLSHPFPAEKLNAIHHAYQTITRNTPIERLKSVGFSEEMLAHASVKRLNALCHFARRWHDNFHPIKTLLDTDLLPIDFNNIRR